MNAKISLRGCLVFLCGLMLSAGHASSAFADYKVVTRDGKTLTWESFSLEDGNYCTWKTNGKFCLPQNDVVSIKETAAKDSPQGDGSSSYNQAAPAQRSGDKSGTMTRSYDRGSVDGRSTYTGRGGVYHNYDSGSSSTTYSKEVDEADIRRMEADEAYRKIQEQDRRAILERERQDELNRQRDQEDQRRKDREKRERDAWMERQLHKR